LRWRPTGTGGNTTRCIAHRPQARSCPCSPASSSTSSLPEKPSLPGVTLCFPSEVLLFCGRHRTLAPDSANHHGRHYARGRIGGLGIRRARMQLRGTTSVARASVSRCASGARVMRKRAAAVLKALARRRTDEAGLWGGSDEGQGKTGRRPVRRRSSMMTKDARPRCRRTEGKYTGARDRVSDWCTRASKGERERISREGR
jgi:hypothetical protein